MSAEITRNDERVRHLARLLWERAGRPHGRNEEFWQTAWRQVASEEEAWADGGAGRPSPGATERSEHSPIG